MNVHMNMNKDIKNLEDAYSKMVNEELDNTVTQHTSDPKTDIINELLTALKRAVSIIEDLPYPENHAAKDFEELINKVENGGPRR